MTFDHENAAIASLLDDFASGARSVEEFIALTYEEGEH